LVGRCAVYKDAVIPTSVGCFYTACHNVHREQSSIARCLYMLQSGM
jgi:hypothetical protein